MAIRNFEISLGTINVKAFIRSTGLTGQCQSEKNNENYLRRNRMVEKKFKVSLSLDKCYKAARHGARTVKSDLGTNIQDNCQTTFPMVLKYVQNVVSGKNNNPIDPEALGINGIEDLLCTRIKTVKLETKPRKPYVRKRLATC